MAVGECWHTFRKFESIDGRKWRFCTKCGYKEEYGTDEVKTKEQEKN